MPRTVFQGDCFKVSHTFEPDGQHNTRIEEYYGDYFTITALLHGHGKCFVEGSCYTLSPGDVIILRANELRRFSFDHGGLHERMTVYISPSVLSPVWRAGIPLLDIFKNRPPGTGNKFELINDNGISVLSVLDEIKSWISAYSDQTDEIGRIEVQLSIIRLLVCLHRSGNLIADDKRYDSDPVIRNVCLYIHKNLSEKLTYEHLQENCHVSRYQLGEIFRHNTGMTVTEYIIQKRLIRVSELVLEGASLENAALSAGFNSYSHFYKMFIRYKGISPKQYFDFFRNT